MPLSCIELLSTVPVLHELAVVKSQTADWGLQACSLQTKLDPPAQSKPPFWGGGLVQVRVLIPPPQVTLQLLKDVDHPPFTGVGMHFPVASKFWPTGQVFILIQEEALLEAFAQAV